MNCPVLAFDNQLHGYKLAVCRLVDLIRVKLQAHSIPISFSGWQGVTETQQGALDFCCLCLLRNACLQLDTPVPKLGSAFGRLSLNIAAVWNLERCLVKGVLFLDSGRTASLPACGLHCLILGESKHMPLYVDDRACAFRRAVHDVLVEAFYWEMGAKLQCSRAPSR